MSQLDSRDSNNLKAPSIASVDVVSPLDCQRVDGVGECGEVHQHSENNGKKLETGSDSFPCHGRKTKTYQSHSWVVKVMGIWEK